MCLAIPAKVTAISEDGEMATISLDGVKKEVSLALVEGVQEGDYVLVHVGYALNRLSPEEAERTLKIFAEAGMVAQSSHHPSTADSDPHALTGRTPSSQLDVASTTPSPSSGPCAQSDRQLDTLATNDGKNSGPEEGTA